MSSLLGKFQRSSLLEIFLEGGRRIFFGPRKGKGAKAGLLFFLADPKASLFPQRHRDWVSRLTEGTPGGLVGKKKPLGCLVFFSGKGVGAG